MIKPGIFGKSYTADTRRSVFDFHNHQILTENKKTDCVFIGDSITEYWDVNVYFDHTKYLVNRGVGGDISEIVAKRFEADVVQLKPESAVCLVGCNDLMMMHYDYWWKVPGRDVEEIESDLLKNISQIIKKSADIKLYICSVLPSAMCVPYDAEKFNRAIVSVNEKLKKICAETGTEYVDFHKALCREDGLFVRDNLTYDGIHPTPEGYQIMAKVLGEKIPELKN